LELGARPESQTLRRSWVLVVLAITPLVIGLVWGTYFCDGAYVTLSYARSLAAGRGLTYNAAAGGQAPLLRSPLYALALASSARLGVPLLQAALILSTLGWVATAIAVYSAGQVMRRPVTAVVSAALVVFSPVMVSTLGTEIPWVLALAWTAIALSIQKHWNAQLGVLVLMLWTRFDLGTLTLAVLLLGVRWAQERRLPLRPGLILAIAALGWGLVAAWQFGNPFLLPHLSPAEWRRSIQQLWDRGELYWLLLPLIGLGLLTATRKTFWAGLLWIIFAVLSGGAVAGPAMAVMVLFLAGLGIDWAIRWIETQDLVQLNHSTLVVGLALVAGLPLGVAQASSLLERYQSRPVIRQGLEQQVGDWLRAHSEPAATVFGSESVGYLADRPTLPWNGGDSDQAELVLLLQALIENPPRYCVSFRGIAWDRLIRTGWFQERYEPLQKFESPYDATSPFTIWGYRSSAFDLGEFRPLSVQLPGKVNLVGYQYWPDRIQPGDAVHVSIFLQATQPMTTAFRTVVRVVSSSDGVGWAQRDMITPRNIPASWWQTGQVIAERFVLTTTAETPIGAYHLNISCVEPGWSRRSFLPMYHNGNADPLYRLFLGYVVVPWQGEMDAATPVGANFGDQISLLGFEVADSLPPGGELDVTLYWEALRQPEDDYTVFVHLLDANGQIVAGHDGPPMDRRYSTKSWIPGEIVPDVHRLSLDPEIPVGTYWVKLGMYRWPSLERLSVWDRQGMEQEDQAIVLQSIEIQ
jgi:hypothetical protein